MNPSYEGAHEPIQKEQFYASNAWICLRLNLKAAWLMVVNMLAPSPEQIRRYQAVYRQVHGVEIPFDQAQEEAIIFLNLIEAIYKPIPKEAYNEISARHQALLKEVKT